MITMKRLKHIISEHVYMHIYMHIRMRMHMHIAYTSICTGRIYKIVKGITTLKIRRLYLDV